MSEDPKGKLLGWVRGTLGKLEQALGEKAPMPPGHEVRAAKAEPAAKPATGPLARGASGPLPGSGPLGRPATGQLPGQRAAQTGNLTRGSDSLTRSGGPVPKAASSPLPPPPPPKDPEEAAQESAKRMNFIVAYMNDPESDPLFKDKQFVYKILTEERSYQQNLIVRLSEELKTAEPGSEAAEGLDEQIAKARTRQGQLFTLLKRLTGIRGKTGGTGFIAKNPDEPPPISSDTPKAPPAQQ